MFKGPLGNRDFRYLLSGFAIGQMLGPLQFLTQILWVQAYAPENVWLILVALIGASRGVGAVTFGLYGGALADRFDRRKLLIVTQVLLVFSTTAIALLMLSGISGVFGFVLFFLLTFLSAGLQAVDAPTRLAIVPDILGPKLTASGMSMNQVAAQLAMPVAMFSAGFVIDALGFGYAYLVSGSGHLIAVFLLMLMRYAPKDSQHTARQRSYGMRETVNDVRFGLAYARQHTVVLWVILLLVTMMSLGFPSTANLGPTWITTVVGVEIRTMGYVVMAWGLGALLAAVALMVFPNIERRGRLIALGALLYCGSFVVFVAHPSVWNAVLGNLGIGAGMTLAMVNSTILIQQLVPNEVRGRIMSIFQLNMGFAQLMTLPIAVAAQWLSLQTLLPIVAYLTLAAVGLILLTRRQLLRA